MFLSPATFGMNSRKTSAFETPQKTMNSENTVFRRPDQTKSTLRVPRTPLGDRSNVLSPSKYNTKLQNKNKRESAQDIKPIAKTPLKVFETPKTPLRKENDDIWANDFASRTYVEDEDFKAIPKYFKLPRAQTPPCSVKKEMFEEFDYLPIPRYRKEEGAHMFKIPDAPVPELLIE